jgi:hypothetical protein
MSEKNNLKKFVNTYYIKLLWFFNSRPHTRVSKTAQLPSNNLSHYFWRPVQNLSFKIKIFKNFKKKNFSSDYYIFLMKIPISVYSVSVILTFFSYLPSVEAKPLCTIFGNEIYSLVYVLIFTTHKHIKCKTLWNILSWLVNFAWLENPFLSFQWNMLTQLTALSSPTLVALLLKETSSTVSSLASAETYWQKKLWLNK